MKNNKLLSKKSVAISLVLLVLLLSFVFSILPAKVDFLILSVPSQMVATGSARIEPDGGATGIKLATKYYGTISELFYEKNFESGNSTYEKYDLSDATFSFPHQMTSRCEGRYLYITYYAELDGIKYPFVFRAKRVWFYTYTDWEMMTDINILSGHIG